MRDNLFESIDSSQSGFLRETAFFYESQLFVIGKTVVKSILFDRGGDIPLTTRFNDQVTDRTLEMSMNKNHVQ